MNKVIAEQKVKSSYRQFKFAIKSGADTTVIAYFLSLYEEALYQLVLTFKDA